LTSVLAGGVWSASIPASLSRGERAPRYPFDKKLGGPPSRSERGGEEKKVHAPTGNRTPVIQPVAQEDLDINCDS